MGAVRLLFTVILLSVVPAGGQQRALIVQPQGIALRKYDAAFERFREVGLSFASNSSYDETESGRDTTVTTRTISSSRLSLSTDWGRKLLEAGGDDPVWGLYAKYGLSVSPTYGFWKNSRNSQRYGDYGFTTVYYGAALGVHGSLELRYRLTKRLYAHNELDLVFISVSVQRKTTKWESDSRSDQGWTYAIRGSVSGQKVSLSSLGLIYYF